MLHLTSNNYNAEHIPNLPYQYIYQIERVNLRQGLVHLQLGPILLGLPSQDLSSQIMLSDDTALFLGTRATLAPRAMRPQDFPLECT